MGNPVLKTHLNLVPGYPRLNLRTKKRIKRLSAVGLGMEGLRMWDEKGGGMSEMMELVNEVGMSLNDKNNHLFLLYTKPIENKGS